jgi:hypothetical protein
VKKAQPKKKAVSSLIQSDENEDDASTIVLDLLSGVDHPPGWELRFRRTKFTKQPEIEYFFARMPPIRDGFKTFLMKRHLWDTALNMPCAEYWAVSDARYAAASGNQHGALRQAKDVLGAIVYPAAAQLNPGPLVRLGAAIRAVAEITPYDQSKSEMTSLYRTALIGCCMILRRLPTKHELTREVEEWTLRKKDAVLRGAALPVHVIRYRQAKDDAARSRDRKSAGLDWLPDNHKTKGRRKG